jgi:23S rRNA-/tRNA-specific pseudouridylate synthase
VLCEELLICYTIQNPSVDPLNMSTSGTGSSRWFTPAINVNEPTVVTIPDPGWYGFFFASETDQVAYQLRIQQATDNIDDAVVEYYDLPFQHASCALTDSNFGFVLVFQKDMRVSVIQCKRDEFAAVAPQQQPSKNHNTLPHWRLIASRLTGQNSATSTSCNKNNSNNNKETTTIPSKQLMCAKCSRTFPTLGSIQQHFQAAHILVEDYSMWTRPLECVFQDEYMAVCIKPHGMPVQGDHPSLMSSDLLLAFANNDKNNPTITTITANDQVTHHNEPTTNYNDKNLVKPRVAHRLDAGTEGLLVVAKTRNAEQGLKLAFATQHAIKKTYWALVIGAVQVTEGECDAPISGKPACTHYRVLQNNIPSAYYDAFTLLECKPITGRRHQIRKHMLGLGHPIVGDVRYRGCRDLILQAHSKPGAIYGRLCLWAVEINVPHPIRSEQRVHCVMEPPKWLQRVIHPSSAAAVVQQ